MYLPIYIYICMYLHIYIYVCIYIYIYIYMCVCVCAFTHIYIYLSRRKFRSQTSDKMDRKKSRCGQSQRREEQKREDQRRDRERGKKMQVREKVEKSRFTLFFQRFVALAGRK